MSFVTGYLALYAPASALNNGKGEDNTGQVKAIRHGRGEYPYATAQALRYWTRETAAQLVPQWQAAPIYRSGAGKRQQSFTEGDPIRYWDDDLFGYMRAEKEGTFTRLAPFRVATLVSVAPVEIVRDFGVMARGEGNPVLHEHEFYRATLAGAFSIDLRMVGTFTWQSRTGYMNLSASQREQAAALGLEEVKIGDHLALRLPMEKRLERVQALLYTLGRLMGGAKQTLHYTDVSPVFVCMAVMKGGNNPFNFLLAPTATPSIHAGALDEALNIYKEDYLSDVYVGMRQGFADDSRALLESRGLTVMHPRQAFDQLSADLRAEWLL
ncbi:type I-B CRISPR-associated protein Cas7/Cst2/DevR [Aggregatilineales bacterium SYSU G02658]